MVLVVVLVHAVAADQMQRRIVRCDVLADRVDVRLVVVVVDRVGLVLAHHAAVLDLVLRWPGRSARARAWRAR